MKLTDTDILSSIKGKCDRTLLNILVAYAKFHIQFRSQLVDKFSKFKCGDVCCKLARHQRQQVRPRVAASHCVSTTLEIINSYVASPSDAIVKAPRFFSVYTTQGEGQIFMRMLPANEE